MNFQFGMVADAFYNGQSQSDGIGLVALFEAFEDLTTRDRQWIAAVADHQFRGGKADEQLSSFFVVLDGVREQIGDQDVGQVGIHQQEYPFVDLVAHFQFP